MKKIYTLMVIVTSLIMIFGISVSHLSASPNLILISYDDKPVLGTVDDDMAIHGKIKNANFFDEITVGLRIYVHEIQNGQGLLICWGETCLPPVIKTGPIAFVDNYKLKAQQESGNNFKCGIEQGGVLGKIRVSFTFFDVNNPNDSVTFTSQAEVVDSITSVNDLSVETILAPNPANEFTSIKLPQNFEILSVSITDITGITVSGETLEQNSSFVKIDVANLSNGIYFVSAIGTNGSAITKRLILSR